MTVDREDGSVPDLPLSAARAHGDLIFLSGQIGVESDGSIPDQFARQAELAMEALLAALADAGSGPEGLLKTTLYLVRAEDFGSMNEIYTRFVPEPRPARTTLVVDLALPELLFEIDAVARPVADR
jgi:2-iminobutanoate/2-iminopropanoate deaminase